MRRTALVGALVGVAAAAWRLRRTSSSERVDLHFDDGSMISFASGSAEGELLLPLAHEVLDRARA
jgi:hypothetical protein